MFRADSRLPRTGDESFFDLACAGGARGRTARGLDRRVEGPAKGRLIPLTSQKTPATGVVDLRPDAVPPRAGTVDRIRPWTGALT